MASVFIGIPTINRPDFVKDAVRSVLAQSYTDFELVVSDNCSDPGVTDSISSFISELDDSRIRFHQQPENIGEYGQGRYFFAAAAQSQYFMILHDDDMLCENYVEKAVKCLGKSPNCAYFVSDATIIDEHGEKSAQVQRKFLADHGRDNELQGEISVLDTHLACGFTLISGTLFRTESLVASGFVDPNGVGNYPFETDIFLRLGDIGVKAWYQKEQLLTFRFHSGSMRHYIKLLDNEKTVNAMIYLFENRQYTGYAERRRRMALGQLFRAKALITVRHGHFSECRRFILKCFSYNIFSVRLWLIAPFALFVPRVLSWVLPALPVTREAPLLRHKD